MNTARTDYPRRLRPVIRHLEQHYAEPLDLAQIAALAALSPYHFHRIFKAVTGETLAAYLRRLRLQAIARQLFYDRQANITVLAHEHGFPSSQALAKAFRQHFGLAPREIRACGDLESLIATLQHSKIGHLLHKSGHAAVLAERDNGRDVNTDVMTHTQETAMHDITLATLAERTLAYIRVTGPYGQGYEAASNRLYQWAGAHQLADGECLFIYLDNPEITPADKCRTDIAITLPPAQADSVPVHGDIEKQHIPGGSYALLRRHVYKPEQYRQYWEEAIAAIVAQGWQIEDDRPCFELYHHYDAASGEADVSFCTAISLSI